MELTDNFRDKYISFSLLKFRNDYTPAVLSKLAKNWETNNITNKCFYHVFGRYDILAINQCDSLPDLNRSQSLNLEENERVDFTHTLAGFTFKGSSSWKFTSKKVVAITQIKLNTAYLISDTEHLIGSIYAHIKSKCSTYKVEFILNYSFSSYELTLGLAANNFMDLNKVITSVRTVTIRTTEKILKFSRVINEKDQKEGQICPIIDTQTQYGVKLTFKENSIAFPNIEKCIPPILTFSMRIKIKSGHMKKFFKIIDTLPEINFFENGKFNFISGQYDVEITDIGGAELNSFINFFFGNRNDESRNLIRECVRDFRTELVFSYKTSILDGYPTFQHTDYAYISILSLLDKLSDEKFEKHIIEHFNIQISSKLFRMINSYHSGLSNPFTYYMFIDFYHILNHIADEYKDIEVSDLEELIKSYESAYLVRHVDESNFENGNEMFLGYNLSIHSLISDIDSIYKMISYLNLRFLKFYNPLWDYEVPEWNQLYFISSFNNSITEAHQWGVNININNVFFPELLFNYIHKESCVSIERSEQEFKPSNVDMPASVFTTYLPNELLDEFQKSYFKNNYWYADYYDVLNIKTSYFIKDYLKYISLFKSDFSNFLKIVVLCFKQSSRERKNDEKFVQADLLGEIYRIYFVAFLHSYIQCNGFNEKNYNNISNSIIREIKQNYKNTFKDDLDEIAIKTVLLAGEMFKDFWREFFMNKNSKYILVDLIGMQKSWDKFINKEPDFNVANVMSTHITSLLNNKKMKIKARLTGGLNVSHKSFYNKLNIDTSLKLSMLCHEFKLKQLTKIKGTKIN